MLFQINLIRMNRKKIFQLLFENFNIKLKTKTFFFQSNEILFRILVYVFEKQHFYLSENYFNNISQTIQ